MHMTLMVQLCSRDFGDDGTLIEITAMPDTNWSFTEFTGDSNSTSSPLVIEKIQTKQLVHYLKKIKQ